jgi:hypothetical protein
MPSLATLTRVVLGFFVPRSLTKTSATPLVSPATRLEAEDEKATTLPLALMALGDTEELKPFASVPLACDLTGGHAWLAVDRGQR